MGRTIKHYAEVVLKKMEEMAKNGGAVVYDYLSETTPVNTPRFGRPPGPRGAVENLIIYRTQAKLGRDPFFVSAAEKDYGITLWVKGVNQHISGSLGAIKASAQQIADLFVLWGRNHISYGQSRNGPMKPLTRPYRETVRCKDGKMRSIWKGGWYSIRKQAKYGGQAVLVASGQLMDSHKAKAITE